MPQPSEHTDNRNFVERILRKIPGFKGYLEKEYRRDSDALQRKWLGDRLQRAKRGLDDLAVTLTDQGRLDALPAVEKLRYRLDRLIGRIRGAMQGYSGVFDLVRIDETVLDEVYQHDLALVDRVETLGTRLEALPGKTGEAGEELAALTAEVDAIEKHWDDREDILRGLE